VNSRDSSGQGVILRWSAGLDSIQWIAAFPKGTVGPLRRIRSSWSDEIRGDSVFVSGDRTVADPLQDGFFLASLSGASSPGAHPSVVWTYDVLCPPRRAGGRVGVSQYKAVQAWDVEPDRKIFLARGSEADFDSAEVVRLGPDGKLTTVEMWNSHVTARGRIWRGSPSSFTSSGGSNDTILYSRLVLKSTDFQAPRTRLRYAVSGGVASTMDLDQSRTWKSDQAGGLVRGAQPLDVLFSGPCREYYHDLSVQFPDSVRCPTASGWSGLSASSRATARIGGLVVERNSRRWALGLTWNALGADGTPLDIPVVMAFESEGRPLWWSRLRSDATIDSTPLASAASLAEIQSLAVGLTQATTGPTLAVASRGRGVDAFWPPAQAKNGPGWRSSLAGLPGPGGSASWIGILTLVDGQFLSSTWQAASTSSSTGDRLADPFYAGWPVPGAAGEALSSTECASVSMDATGNILTSCQGERPLVTLGAFRQIPSPGEKGPSGWNVLTLWNPSLKAPLWASAFDGDRSSGDSGVGFAIDDQFMLPDNSMLVAAHPLRVSSRLAAVNAPGWATPDGDVVLAILPPSTKSSTSPARPIQNRPVLRRVQDRLHVQAPGSGDGFCAWIDPSGRQRGRSPLLDGQADIALPLESGILLLQIKRGERTWTLPCPILR